MSLKIILKSFQTTLLIKLNISNLKVVPYFEFNIMIVTRIFCKAQLGKIISISGRTLICYNDNIFHAE